jgi:hypothetical protein
MRTGIRRRIGQERGYGAYYVTGIRRNLAAE